MKKKLKFIIAFILSILIICFLIFVPVSCNKKDYYMKTLIEQEMTYTQYDSLCKKDNIPMKFEEWNSTFFLSSDKKLINQFLYTVYNDDTLIVYTAILDVNTIFVTKRIEYEIKK